MKKLYANIDKLSNAYLENLVATLDQVKSYQFTKTMPFIVGIIKGLFDNRVKNK